MSGTVNEDPRQLLPLHVFTVQPLFTLASAGPEHGGNDDLLFGRNRNRPLVGDSNTPIGAGADKTDRVNRAIAEIAAPEFGRNVNVTRRNVHHVGLKGRRHEDSGENAEEQLGETHDGGGLCFLLFYRKRRRFLCRGQDNVSNKVMVKDLTSRKMGTLIVFQCIFSHGELLLPYIR